MTVKICPECEAENPASEEICGQCSFPLEELVEADTAAAADLRCGNCSQVITVEMKFCDGCGINLNEPVTPPSPPSESGDDTLTSLPEDTGLDETLESVVSPPNPPPPPASVEENFKLSVVEGFSLGKEYLLYKPEMLLGRMDREENVFPDIDLEDQDDGYVSRKHAIIRCEGGSVTVEDLGTENGTSVDNRPIPAHKTLALNPSQVLRLGKVSLMLKRHKTY